MKIILNNDKKDERNVDERKLADVTIKKRKVK